MRVQLKVDVAETHGELVSCKRKVSRAAERETALTRRLATAEATAKRSSADQQQPTSAPRATYNWVLGTAMASALPNYGQAPPRPVRPAAQQRAAPPAANPARAAGTAAAVESEDAADESSEADGETTSSGSETSGSGSTGSEASVSAAG